MFLKVKGFPVQPLCPQVSTSSNFDILGDPILGQYKNMFELP